MDDAPRPASAAPRLALVWLEQRAVFEFGALLAASPWLRLVGRGDRRPVLVLPGFTAGDRATAPLRWTLRSWGYWTHGWGLGLNLGPRPSVVVGLAERLEAIHRRHGQPVSLIGWSLGGMYARELARAYPDAVRDVITLGSPYRMTLDDRNTLTPLVERVRPAFGGRDIDLPREDEKVPLTVPATSIYSRTDGIVRWHHCIDRPGPQRENIEVRGSHTGLVVNPAVLYAIGDRLAQPQGDWRPFSAPPFLRRLYPSPADYDVRGTESRAG